MRLLPNMLTQHYEKHPSMKGLSQINGQQWSKLNSSKYAEERLVTATLSLGKPAQRNSSLELF